MNDTQIKNSFDSFKKLKLTDDEQSQAQGIQNQFKQVARDWGGLSKADQSSRMAALRSDPTYAAYQKLIDASKQWQTDTAEGRSSKASIDSFNAKSREAAALGLSLEEYDMLQSIPGAIEARRKSIMRQRGLTPMGDPGFID